MQIGSCKITDAANEELELKNLEATLATYSAALPWFEMDDSILMVTDTNYVAEYFGIKRGIPFIQVLINQKNEFARGGAEDIVLFDDILKMWQYVELGKQPQSQEEYELFLDLRAHIEYIRTEFKNFVEHNDLPLIYRGGEISEGELQYFMEKIATKHYASSLYLLLFTKYLNKGVNFHLFLHKVDNKLYAKLYPTKEREIDYIIFLSQYHKAIQELKNEIAILDKTEYNITDVSKNLYALIAPLRQIQRSALLGGRSSHTIEWTTHRHGMKEKAPVRRFAPSLVKYLKEHRDWKTQNQSQSNIITSLHVELENTTVALVAERAETERLRAEVANLTAQSTARAQSVEVLISPEEQQRRERIAQLKQRVKFSVITDGVSSGVEVTTPRAIAESSVVDYPEKTIGMLFTRGKVEGAHRIGRCWAVTDVGLLNLVNYQEKMIAEIEERGGVMPGQQINQPPRKRTPTFPTSP